MKQFGITLAVLTTLTVAAVAQQPQRPTGGQGTGNPRNAPNGQANTARKFPPAAEQLLASMRRMRDSDPAKSVSPVLIKRSDVRGELGLDPKQREALEAAKKKDAINTEAKLNDNQFFIAIQEKLADIAKLPLAEQENARKEAIESLKEQGQKLADSVRGDLENTTNSFEKILRPEQNERLRQLDWQWRGPLALSDPKMNDIFQLSMEQQEAISKLVQEFREQQHDILDKALGQDTKSPVSASENGEKIDPQSNFATGDSSGEKTLGGGKINSSPLGLKGDKGKPAPPKTEIEIQNRYDVVKRDVTALNKKYSEMVLRLLAPEQRQYWFQSLGRQFAFRAND